MNGLNNSADDVVECPLCMEPLEVDDLNFYPCTCGYQICRFCWHRIRTDENELCPACRKEYPENPADFTPLTQEEMMAFKSQKRQRDQQRKQKITENRKHLSNVRVVQRNLVFVVGLPPRLADADILKKHEYFGKFGKIHKVVINPSTTYAGVQGPSASAYVTYVHNSDALRAIQSVNNVMFDGRLIKTSLGTTKYCSHFMKNQQCPKGDCMYLHELGDPEASFTKEEMHQGKHQEYEKRLHDALIATSGTSSASGMGTPSIGNCVSSGNSGGSTNCTTSTNANGALTSHSNHCKNGDSNKLVNGNSTSSSSSVSSSVASSMSTSSSSSSSSSTNSGTAAAITAAAVAAGTTQQKDAWPSLSVSPVNNKEGGNNGIGHSGGGGANIAKSKKEKSKHEKSKHERNGKNNKNKNNNNHSNSNLTTNKENHHPHSHSNGTKDILHNSTTATPTLDSANLTDNKMKAEKNNKMQPSSSAAVTQRNGVVSTQRTQKDQQHVISVDDEVKLIENLENRDCINIKSRNVHHRHNSDENGHCDGNAISDEQRSLSTSSSNSSDTTSTLSECTSGKSSPGGFPEHHQQHNSNTTDVTATTAEIIDSADRQQQQQSKPQQQQTTLLDGSNDNSSDHHNHQQSLSSSETSPISSKLTSISKINGENNKLDGGNSSNSTAIERQQKLAAAIEQISGSSSNHMMDTTTALSKINFFDDNNSFFSSAASFQQSLLLKNKMEADMRQNQLNSVISSQLPDLLNGVDGFPSNTTNSNEWGEAFKNVMMRNNKQMEEHLHHQHLQQQQHQQRQQQQEEFLRMQELQKPPNNLLNNIGLSQINGPHNDFPNNFHGATDLSRLSQTALIQQQQQILQQQQQERLQHSAHPSDHILGNSLFGTNNMSKFFDFHKNQQQIHQQVPQMKENQQFLMNGHGSGNNVGNGPISEHLRIASLLENNRINSQFLDQTNGLLSQHQQQQLQKQRLHGKFDPMVNAAQNLLTNLNLNLNIVNQQLPHQQQQSQNSQQPQQNQQQQSRIPNQFSHNSSVEDDLGFDPFIETQKALAELMEKEVVQQQNTNIGSSGSNNSTAVAATILQQQQQQHQQQQHQHQQLTQQQLLDNMQRARMPPPGFNHMNAFGFGVPRAQNSSKILPFMNMSGNGGAGGGTGANGQQPPQPQMQMPNSWNPHMAAALHQQQHQQQHALGGDPQMHMNPQQQQNQNGGNHNKGYSSNDWTAMDPAILSFRQFSSFPQQQQMQHHPSQQDMFMQHFSQQQQQQQQQQQNGFGSQPQMHGGVNMPNGLLNQNSPAQVNLSHSNWLSTEQSLFMNSLANSFTTNNNFDKFSIPMPPGIHPNNLNKQQKTECIN